MSFQFCFNVFKVNHFKTWFDMSCCLLSLRKSADVIVIWINKIVLSWFTPGILRSEWALTRSDFNRWWLDRFIGELSVFFFTNAIIDNTELIIYCKFIDLRRVDIWNIIDLGMIFWLVLESSCKNVRTWFWAWCVLLSSLDHLSNQSSTRHVLLFVLYKNDWSSLFFVDRLAFHI